MKLGYWKLKGRAFPTRCLLHHAGIEFEDVIYTSDNKADWFGKLKPELAKSAKPVSIPSIPYIIDNDTHIFQSMACLQYAARKAGYVATTEQGKQVEDILNGVFTEYFDGLGKARFGSNKEEDTKAWVEKTLNNLNGIADILKNSSGAYLTGEKISWIDFYLFQIVHFLEFVGGKVENEIICAHKAKICGNERLAAYLESVKDVPAMP